MYAPFFGLEHAPFSIAPDPRYLFMSERHREALAHLLYGLDAGGGFVLLTGEIGTGKTTVCRCFLEQIPAHCNVAYIFNPKLTVPELLRSICEEFGVAPEGAGTVKDCIDPLNAFLLAQHAAGRNNVLIIDEAQNLAPDVLEQLRLLTNLETSERKLLQVILIGQPELRTMVAAPKMEQLAQRVIARYHLGPLTQDETRHYVAHRLAVAGWRGPLPFQRGALGRIHALSGGVPRRINLLCDRALLGAYAAGVREVGDAMVRKAAREVFDAPGRAARPRWRTAGAIGAGVLAGAAAMAGAGWALGLLPARSAAPVAQKAKAPASPAVSAASAPVPAPSASAPASAPAPQATLSRFLAAQPSGDSAAWQVLAQSWQATLPAGAADPCAALAGEGLRCYRSRRASLSLLRQIDRPVLLTLQPAGGQASVAAVLQRIEGPPGAQVAQLAGAGGATLRAPVAELAPLWRGEIATLWKAPANLPMGDDVAATAAGGHWLNQQLKRAGVAGATRGERLHQFQLSQGITPDGQAGPLTLMLLGRAAGVPEPRLHY